MKVVFADTGYWVAVLNPKDDWNNRANELSRSLGKFRIVTSEMVLDELNIATKYEYVQPAVVVEELRKKRAMLHVVMTGRNASPEVIEIADLVSEMKVIKHPYSSGIQPQRGVEF